jgi:hypothetical protein
MFSPYIAAATTRAAAGTWFVLHCKDGRIVARGMTQARAMTLAATLNSALSALRVVRGQTPKQPPRRSAE